MLEHRFGEFLNNCAEYKENIIYSLIPEDIRDNGDTIEWARQHLSIRSLLASEAEFLYCDNKLIGRFDIIFDNLSIIYRFTPISQETTDESYINERKER